MSTTLAKLTYSLSTGMMPRWVRGIGPQTVVIIDEAGMAGTADLAQAVEYVTSRGGSVRLVGDDQQLASIAAGGVLRDIERNPHATRIIARAWVKQRWSVPLDPTERPPVLAAYRVAPPPWR